MRLFRDFLVALGFLSLLPVRIENHSQPEDSARALPYYPLAGLVIGALLALMSVITNALPENIRAALVLACWVLATGGLHLDGLADSADAWLGGFGDREKTLAIMKDPYCGPVAVVALILLLLIKFTALEFLLGQHAWESLVVAPVLARSALVGLFLTTPYVRPRGLGSGIAAYLPRRNASIAILLVIALLPWCVGILAIPLLLATGITFFGLRLLMLRRLGGTTGDTAGALVELCETAALMTAVFAG